MDAQPLVWSRVKWTRAAQLAALADAEAEIASCGDLAPENAFAVLRADTPVTAARFVAQCLSRLDALRWLAGCLARTPAPAPDTPRAAVRAGLAAWLAQPGDKRRRLVYAEAEAAGFDTIEGAAGLALFLSGGSLAPAELEHGAPPLPGGFGRAVAGAVLLCALAHGPERFIKELRAMLLEAERIASGAPA